MVFRFEAYENVISKHHLKNTDWRQAAHWAFLYGTAHKDASIASVKMIDENTVEIIKRKDQNRGFWYNLGFDQQGLYERVTINRKEATVAVDRMDANWWIAEPFLAQRDLFYVEKQDKADILSGKVLKPRLAFVRHNFWLHKVNKFNAVFWSNFSASSYKRAFGAHQV